MIQGLCFWQDSITMTQKSKFAMAMALTSSSSSSAAATGVKVLHAVAEALGQLLGHDNCSHGEAIANGLP